MTAKSALIIGGTGQVGRAVADRLGDEGWEVTVAHRRPAAGGPAGVRTVLLDRDDDAALRSAADGADLVVDTVAYGPGHAAQLLGLAGRIGSAVVMSTGSVYLGRNGVHFGSGPAEERPIFDLPLTESSPVITDDDGSYGSQKAAMERVLLGAADLPVSVLRLGSVHGPHSPKLREWYFIKRALDGRHDVVLARGGRARFSTASSINIAELVRLCAGAPATRVLNAIDEDDLTLSDKARTIYHALGRPVRIHSFDGPPRGELGADPWDQAHPFVMGMERARSELGYRPPLDYAGAVEADLAWLLPALAQADSAGGDWADIFPSVVARHGRQGWFRYDLEDDWLSSRGH